MCPLWPWSCINLNVKLMEGPGVVRKLNMAEQELKVRIPYMETIVHQNYLLTSLAGGENGSFGLGSSLSSS